MNLSQATQQCSSETEVSANNNNNNSTLVNITGVDEDIFSMTNADIFPSIDESLIDYNLEDFGQNFITQSLEPVPPDISTISNSLFLGNAANTACDGTRNSHEEVNSTIYDFLLDLVPMQAADTVLPFEHSSTELNSIQNSAMTNELGLKMDTNFKRFNSETIATSQQFCDGNIAPRYEFLSASQSSPSAVGNTQKLPNIMNVSPDNRKYSDSFHRRNDEIIVPVHIMRLLQHKDDMFKDVKEVLESTDPKTMQKGKKISKKTRVNMMALFF